MTSTLPWHSQHSVPSALVEAAAHLEREVVKRQKRAALLVPEGKLASRVRIWFGKQERAFMRRLDASHARMLVSESRLREAGDIPDDWETLYDEAAQETSGYAQTSFLRWLESALGAGWTNGLSSYGVTLSFALEHPQAAAYASERAADLVSQVDNVTKKQMRKLITDAVSEGQSYSQLAKQIRERFADMRTPKPQLHIRDRAEGIAIQELGEAYEAGNYAAGQTLQRSGLEVEKQWLTVGDARVSQTICAPNEAQGWIPFRSEYQSGHLRPLGHVGCRCTQSTRVKPEAG